MHWWGWQLSPCAVFHFQSTSLWPWDALDTDLAIYPSPPWDLGPPFWQIYRWSFYKIILNLFTWPTATKILLSCVMIFDHSILQIINQNGHLMAYNFCESRCSCKPEHLLLASSLLLIPPPSLTLTQKMIYPHTGLLQQRPHWPLLLCLLCPALFWLLPCLPSPPARRSQTHVRAPLWEVAGVEGGFRVHIPFSISDPSQIEKPLGSFTSKLCKLH